MSENFQPQPPIEQSPEEIQPDNEAFTASDSDNGSTEQHIHIRREGEIQDERWDLQKAETIAPVLKDFPGIQEKIEENNRIAKTPWTNSETGKAMLDEGRQDVLREVNAATRPYEDLYDRKPEKFANMPTSEFMKIAGGYYDVVSDTIWLSNILQRSDQAISIFEKRIEDKENDVSDFYDILANIQLIPSDKDREELLTELEKIRENYFDITPRQFMEEHVAIAKRFRERREKELAEAESRKQQILDEHASVTPEQ